MVLPLMLLQIGLHSYSLFVKNEFIEIITLVFILVSWFFTFCVAVPIHSKLLENKFDKHLLLKLVKVNWYRTISWSMVFIITVLLN